jgi:hypothetical protein
MHLLILNFDYNQAKLSVSSAGMYEWRNVKEIKKE